MSAWLSSIAGTPAGHQAAIALALAAAALHAAFGSLQKGRHDPWMTRGATDISYGLMMLPVALFVVPRPEPRIWALLGGAFVIHTIYKLLQASAYARGEFTVVYPVVRGTGPLVTVIAAGFVFSEQFAKIQWAGVGALSLGILSLGAINLRRAPEGIAPALVLAVLTGFLVAAYTTYDAYGIRSATDPLTFLVWFFVVDGFAFPLIAVWRWNIGRIQPGRGPLALRGIAGGMIALMSFGAIMMATYLDRVGEAAV
ncbi:MAG: EamA family transporter, partial [Paracoccaceae bacterium]